MQINVEEILSYLFADPDLVDWGKAVEDQRQMKMMALNIDFDELERILLHSQATTVMKTWKKREQVIQLMAEQVNDQANQYSQSRLSKSIDR
uniref:Uncharacterized protein n=1 Tax=Ditylenchus dipsaci TaxID=166011 RepID=A0A915CXP2_9BILA